MIPSTLPLSTAPPPTAPPAPQPAPRGVRWIGLDEAAKRAGKSLGHLRRLCGTQWVFAGTARTVRGQGKKPYWEIREDADASVARVKFSDQLSAEFDMRSLTDSQRRTVNDRLRLVKAWEDQRAAGVKLSLSEVKVTANFLQRLLIDEDRRLSRGTLYNWLSGYRREGIGGLVDERWKSPRNADGESDPFLDEVKRLFLLPRQLKLARCHLMASYKAEGAGWPVRAYKACQRMIDRVPKSEILKYRFGDTAYTNEAEPYIERDYSTLASNEQWCGDHHQFDVVVQIGERADPQTGELSPIYARPWLTAWMDVRSRFVVGWEIFAHDPNQDTIIEAFRRGILANGVPQNVYIDNGKDYDSWSLHGRTKRQRQAARRGSEKSRPLSAWRKRQIKLEYDVRHITGAFTLLKVGAIHAAPYHPQSKLIERWFGTIEDQFGRTFDTYFGGEPKRRPEDFDANLAAGKAPQLVDFIAAFESYLAQYHGAKHTGDSMDGRSPLQIHAECLATKITVTPDEADFYLLKPSKPVKVGQNGATFNGLRYGQYEPALQAMLGKEVILRVDTNDPSRAIVTSLGGDFICIAPSNERIPANADSETLREAMREKRRHRRVLADYHQVRPRLSEDLPELMIRAAAAKNAAAGTDRPDPSLPPPSLKAVQSPLAGALKDYQQAVERGQMKIAVGAESLSLDGYRAGEAERESDHPSLSIADYRGEGKS